MIYQTSNEYERKEAVARFKYLLKYGKTIVLTEQKQKRTLSQNAYFHVLVDIYAMEYGMTRSEAKINIKRRLGYVYEKNGEEFYTETSGMSKDEMSELIERFLIMSANDGLYLPSSEEYLQNYSRFERERKRALKYLEK